MHHLSLRKQRQFFSTTPNKQNDMLDPLIMKINEQDYNETENWTWTKSSKTREKYIWNTIDSRFNWSRKKWGIFHDIETSILIS